MKVQFKYDKEKDAWCIQNKGKTSINSKHSTKQYEQLVSMYGEEYSSENLATFIQKYIAENNIDIESYISRYQSDWDLVSDVFTKRAEDIFETRLPADVTGYLTINSRCPYSITNSYFFVAMPTPSSRRTAMHELWHFYTWYGPGAGEETRLGKEKYNELKEALTVLLNIECKDLLPEGMIDAGYPQHQELRKQVVDFWSEDRSMKNLWSHFTQ